MKVVSFDSARVTWLFPLEEFTPAAGLDATAVLAEIAARYNFGMEPKITTRDDMAKNGLPYGVGRFVNDGEPILINDFGIYNDGIVAVTGKTEWSDAFLNDVVDWVTERFGFQKIVSGIRKAYSSTLVVDFERPLSRLIAGYEQISELISARTKTLMSDQAPMQFSRLDFEIDKQTFNSGQVAVPKFVLERRGGVGFSQERYFTTAPMHTTDHLAVLEQLEKLAAGEPSR
jgi:hypothetical protein